MSIPLDADFVAELPPHWRAAQLGDLVTGKKATLDPRSRPDEQFNYYSIPAYQEWGRSVVETGERIRSHKLLVSPGTVLFGRLNPRLPKVWQVRDENGLRSVASTEFIPLEPVEDVDAGYLYYLAWSRWVLPRAQILVSGSTPSRQRVDTRSFLRLVVPVPTTGEQRAIARVLHTVQEARDATVGVLAALHHLKRSAMKRLFTSGSALAAEVDEMVTEGSLEHVPQTWSVAPLGELAETRSGGTPDRSHPDYFGGEIPWLKSGELTDGAIMRTEESITQSGLANSNARVLPRGTLVMALYGATAGRVGLLGLDMATNQAICAILPHGGRVTSDYLFHALMWRRGVLLSERHGGAQPNLSQRTIRLFPLPVPPRRDQDAIVHVLKTIDQKIAVEGQRRIALDALFSVLLDDLMSARIQAWKTANPPS